MPLLSGSVTTGTLGFVKIGDREWLPEELNALQAIATLFAQVQARIQAEQGMLQTDATKLNVLYQAAQAQEWARKQSALEQVVSGVGNLRTLPALRLP